MKTFTAAFGLPPRPIAAPFLGFGAGAVLLAVVALGFLAGSACSTAAAPQETCRTYADCFQQAMAAMERDDRETAQTLFEMALQRNPDHPYPHYYLGVLYADKDQLDLALVALHQAIKLEPNLHEAHYNLGTIYLQRRELRAAVEALERAIELEPDHAPSYNNLGKAYYLAGLPELAGAAYEEALARDPDNEIALENLMLLARAAGATEAEERYRALLEDR